MKIFLSTHADHILGIISAAILLGLIYIKGRQHHLWWQELIVQWHAHKSSQEAVSKKGLATTKREAIRRAK